MNKEVFKLIKLSELEKLISKNLEKPLLVVFKWEDCGICKTNIPLIENMLLNDLNEKTINVWIDVDGEDIWAEDNKNPNWLISLVPTYHLYNKNAKLVFKHVAFLAPIILKKEIEKIL